MLTGGAGADVFLFEAGAFGSDVITDFAAGAGRTDRIWLIDQGPVTFADVLASAQNSAAGVVISVNGGAITLAGVTVAQLVADDFIFG
jgi:Ca2+-binding RTX toxin-like protein